MEEALPSVNKRIKDLIEARFDGNVRAFSRALGLPDSQKINRLFNLDRRSSQYPAPSAEVLRLISNTFDISLDWLLSGEGEMLKDGGQLSIVADSTASYTPSKQKLVPYYDVDFVGGFELVCNSQTATPTYFVDFQQYNEGDCWCNVTGRSMEPKIGHGDKMCLREVKRWKEFLPFGEVYAIVTEEFRTVKIITKSDKPDHFKLVPFNPDPEFAPQDIPISMIQRVFRVLGCCKNL